MSDMTQSEPAPSSSDNAQSGLCDDVPLAKKRKLLSEREHSEKLEHRLGGILCCAVCLELPPAAVYQCTNGHLMCAPCFTHLLADARLRDEPASCPNCRIGISKTTASRNLAVEKTVSELPLECRYCTHVFPRHSLQHHEENICEERRYTFTQIVVDARGSGGARALLAVLRAARAACGLPLTAPAPAPRPRAPAGPMPVIRLTGCKYACIGCGWRGPARTRGAHEERCTHPSKSAAELVAVLAERDQRTHVVTVIYEQIFELLSYEKITFNDLQLKPYRTEEFVHKLYYETSRFSAFGHHWVMKAFVNKNQRDPTQSSQREITYQLILKSKAAAPLNVQWVVTRGPWGEARLVPTVGAYCFRDEACEAPPLLLPVVEPRDTNHLLATMSLHCRLIMFLSSK